MRDGAGPQNGITGEEEEGGGATGGGGRGGVLSAIQWTREQKARLNCRGRSLGCLLRLYL